MSDKFIIPKTTYIGEGALSDAQKDLCSLGKKALIVTGKSMICQGHMKTLTSILEKNQTEYVIFSDITGEPTDVMIESGLAVYKENNCDFIIGFGGGSPIDSAKAIGAMSVNSGKISDYNGRVITGELPPVAAIPSTAGTGSEATQFTIISDTKNNIKMLLKGQALLPILAVIEPQFTFAAPKNVTAATGLDALTHAVEAYTSKKATPFTDMYAISAIKKIFKYLPAAYKDGNDREARVNMAVAAYEAGVCINNSSVTIVHGMSRPVGALFHVPHGLSNAMLLQECLKFAVDGAYERFAQLGRAVKAARDTDSDIEAADKFIAALGDICAACEVMTLSEYGVDKDSFLAAADKMAHDAYDSGSPSNTRKTVTKEDMIAIYKKLI